MTLPSVAKGILRYDTTEGLDGGDHPGLSRQAQQNPVNPYKWGASPATERGVPTGEGSQPLALRAEEGAVRPTLLEAAGSYRKEGLSRGPRRTRPCQHFDFNPLGHVPELCPPTIR